MVAVSMWHSTRVAVSSLLPLWIPGTEVRCVGSVSFPAELFCFHRLLGTSGISLTCSPTLSFIPSFPPFFPGLALGGVLVSSLVHGLARVPAIRESQSGNKRSVEE